MKNNLLIIFTKAPDDPDAKTRLQDFYPKDWVQELNLLFLETLKDSLGSSEKYDVIWALANDSSHPFFEDCSNVTQFGEGLGARLRDIWSRYQNQYKKIIVIGSDAPQVSREDILEAFEYLEDYDSVMGPAVDGGFYLFGTNSDFNPCIFEKISYSESKTGSDLSHRVKPFILEENFDVDDSKGVEVLFDFLEQVNRTSIQEKLFQHIKKASSFLEA